MVEGRGVGQAGVELRLAPPGHRAPADVGNLQPGGVQALHRPLQQADPLRAPQLGGALEQQLHAHADADDRHAGVAALVQKLVEAERAHELHGPRHGPHARAARRASAARTSSWSRVRVGPGAHVLQRLLHRAQVAHAVVQDRDVRGGHSSPLVEGTPGSPGSIETASRRARAKALNAASTMWWVVGAALDRHVDRQLARVAHRAQELLQQVGVEVAHRGVRQLPLQRHVGTPGDVQRTGGAGLVHRHHGVAVAADAVAVAQRLVQRAAQHDARVLHGVVGPVCEVALGGHVQVQPAVAGHRVQHVVEEAHPGGRARPRPGRPAPGSGRCRSPPWPS